MPAPAPSDPSFSTTASSHPTAEPVTGPSAVPCEEANPFQTGASEMATTEAASEQVLGGQVSSERPAKALPDGAFPDPRNRRREKRFKTDIDRRLKCCTSVDEPGYDRVWDGTAVDISASGLRLLTDGKFEVGQAIWTELKTTRSHGVYRGTVRRIEPWVGGQWILGCSLRDLIPQEVLQELASDGVINRRSDGRFDLTQRATISWPLLPEEIVVELRDYSTGGMKLLSPEPIPGTARLRLQFASGGSEVAVEAKSIWSRAAEGGWMTGIAFTDPRAPAIVLEGLQNAKADAQPSVGKGRFAKLRKFVTAALCVVMAGLALYVAM